LIASLKRFTLSLLRFLFRLTAIGHKKKRILLVANNSLMFDYVNHLRRLVDSDSRLSFVITAPSKTEFGSFAERCRSENLSRSGYLRSRLLPWDLIVFADHWIAPSFDPASKKLLVNHAISGGKIVHGLPYRYNPDLINYPDGRRLYDRIFEASQEICNRVLAHQPDLTDVIAVVGDLRADQLLAMQADREEIRQRLGFEKSEIVVLVQSTWGPSIMESMGRELIAQCRRLTKQNRYRFILSTHPKHWSGAYAEKHPWGKFLLGQEGDDFVIAKPEDDWAPLMIASDITLTDHTSLAVTYALLGKPMLYVALPEAKLVEQFPVWKLSRVLPQLSEPETLEADLQKALTQFPADEVAAIAAEIVAYPGEAANRMTKHFYELLNLSPAAREIRQSSK